MPSTSVRRFFRSRLFFPAIAMLGLAALFWPARQLRSDNFIFYFPSGHNAVPVENLGNVKYLPLLQVLNTVGKVGGITEKRNSLKVFFGDTPIELRANAASVQVAKSNYPLSQSVRVNDGQWLVPVEFLTIVVPHLTHQAVEYQQGTDRIFIGDVKPFSFTVRVDAIPNGARLTVQFTDKVSVRTAAQNGKWVMYLGDRPMEPMEPSYRFQNPYISALQYDDQDGVPKLILSPGTSGLNFYPVAAAGGKVLMADVVKPAAPTAAQTLPPAAPRSAPAAPQATPQSPAPQVTAESPPAAPGVLLPVVALDAGHGGDDNGGKSSDGVLEKNLVAQYVERVRAAVLATANFRVVLSRPGDVNVTFEQRALAANLSGAICFLTFHAGDLGGTSPQIAVFTFAPPTAAEPPSGDSAPSEFVPWGQVQEAKLAQSQQLAITLQQQFAMISGVEADMPETAPVRTLRSVNAPAVAIELGRLAPDADASALSNPNFQQQVANAVVQALLSFSKGGN